jgi:hypothetical protein
VRTSSLLAGWSDWVPLEGAGRNRSLPASPGLYRIRRVGREQLDYIGETSNSLRGRLGMLRGIYRDVMPYRDPHTAAPALWALRHSSQCAFEASVLPFDGSDQEREGLEAAAITLYRQEWRCSPTVNFGRMPVGYRMSSGNNADLEKRGKRVIGGATTEQDESHHLGIAPASDLAGAPTDPRWCGHKWSAWHRLPDELDRLPDTKGLYRLTLAGDSTLVYVGQGSIATRIRDHLAKGSIRGHRQQRAFADERLSCSYVEIPDALRHHRLELEMDLIGAHVVAIGAPPTAQFLG